MAFNFRCSADEGLSFSFFLKKCSSFKNIWFCYSSWKMRNLLTLSKASARSGRSTPCSQTPTCSLFHWTARVNYSRTPGWELGTSEWWDSSGHGPLELMRDHEAHHNRSFISHSDNNRGRGSFSICFVQHLQHLNYVMKALHRN